MNTPDNLFYTRNHEWVNINKGIATIGITDYAQSELGDIIFIEFPNISTKFNAGDTICIIEAVKTVADLYSPLGGRIIEINNNLENEPESINKDPYGSGWIVKLDLETEDLSSLLSASKYKELMQ